MDNQKFETLMYFLLKEAARESFVDFLDDIGLTEKDYNDIKAHIETTYDVKLYL